jgi:YidC/Oxa1 family membrane protein insertase
MITIPPLPWLYDAVSWILLRFHDLFSLVFPSGSGAAWGLAIVGLVVVIRIALLPLFAKQIKAQRGLQALQPQMKAIQKKYANDKERQSQELMKLYKETGTNPLSSCLPILAQSPFFFALFTVLNQVAQGNTVGVMTPQDVESMKDATVFGAPISATFLNAPNVTTQVVAAVLIVLMSLTTFITQRQLMVKNMPSGQDNPLAQQQKILLYVFPLMFAVFGVNFPIGVLIYWFTTNLWTMGQQFYVIRRNPTPGSPAAEALEARRAQKAKDKARAEMTAAADALAGDAATEGVPPARTSGQRQQPVRKPKSQRPRAGGKPAGTTGPTSGAAPDPTAGPPAQPAD